MAIAAAVAAPAPPPIAPPCGHGRLDIQQPDPGNPDRVLASCLDCGSVALVRFARGVWRTTTAWVPIGDRRPGMAHGKPRGHRAPGGNEEQDRR